MNKLDALELFRKHDDPDHLEYAVGFDYPSALTRVQEFCAALDRATGRTHEFETGGQIQDASFHSQIKLPTGWLRFSSFGDMVALVSDQDTSEPTLDLVQRLCGEGGYTFVPEQFTALPYTGLAKGVYGIPDWATRFFDWL